MRHYEITFLVHPDQSEQLGQMAERYKKLIATHNGIIHRFEDCGRKHLAYAINKVNKAHYVLLNLEANNALLDELNHAFKFNDAILRSLVTVRKTAVSTPSVFMKDEKAKSLM